MLRERVYPLPGFRMVVFDGSGFLSPTLDDVFRILILVVGLLNIAVIAVGLFVMERYARLLIDVEQMTREARNKLREQLEQDVTGLAAHSLFRCLPVFLGKRRAPAESRTPRL